MYIVWLYNIFGSLILFLSLDILWQNKKRKQKRHCFSAGSSLIPLQLTDRSSAKDGRRHLPHQILGVRSGE